MLEKRDLRVTVIRSDFPRPSAQRKAAIAKESRILWTGPAIYAVSFFLVGVRRPESGGGPVRGCSCAWTSLVLPWTGIDLWSQGVGPILMPAALIAGWINPIFVAATVVSLTQRRRLFAVFRIVVLLMFPACWIVFFFGFWPREGYFIWTIGMLLVLFWEGLADLTAGRDVEVLKLGRVSKT